MEGPNINMTEGSVKRTERVTVKYEKGSKPTFDIALERPYEVSASGQTSGVDVFTVNKKGGYAGRRAEVSQLGLMDSLRAAYSAWGNARLSGGITSEDKSIINQAANAYNAAVRKFRKIVGSKTVLETGAEVSVNQLSDRELSELL